MCDVPRSDYTTPERCSSMLEMMIEMAYNNPGSLSEEELKDHMITFVATVGGLIITSIMNSTMKMKLACYRVKTHNLQQSRSL